MAKKKKSGISKLVFVIIFSILVMTLIPSGIYCAVERINPIQMVSSIITFNNDDLIIGKWQNEERTSAYEFFEDGTYKSYFTQKYSLEGEYSIKGNKLTLLNPSTNQTVVYTFSVNKKSLEMLIYQENGLDSKSDTDQTVKYNKVDRIELRDPLDALGIIVDSLKEGTTDASEE